MNRINIEKLRKDLIDYYGTAVFSGFHMAMVDVSDVENASQGRLIELAGKAGFSLKNYEEEELER